MLPQEALAVSTTVSRLRARALQQGCSRRPVHVSLLDSGFSGLENRHAER